MIELPAQINRVSIASGDTVSTNDNPAGSPLSSKPEDKKSQSSSKLLRNIKGIIFDFDGTLFDNKGFPFHLIRSYPFDLLRVWKERLTRKEFTGSDHGTPEEYYRAFFIKMGKLCWRSPATLRKWYFEKYMPRMVRAIQNNYELRPGVLELFQIFESEKPSLKFSQENKSAMPKIAIYSDYPLLKERLEVIGLEPGKDILLYGPDSFGAQKPAVRPFQRIAQDMKTSPEEILVIGDREDTDGIGAFKAGMRFFCLDTGRRKRYFKLDPYRNAPEEKEHQGPGLLMYTGVWEDLHKLLKEKYG